MSLRNQLLCAWCGPLFLGLFGLGYWVCARYLPPHSPDASAEAIAAIFQSQASMIRVGQVLLQIASAFTVPFAAVISIQLMRIEGRQPVLAYSQLGSGIVAAVFLLLPTLIWCAVAFRPERSPELTQFGNDLAWIIFLMTFAPACVQLLMIGLAILGDKSKTPVFPRWSGYLNLWVSVSFLPAGLIPFFKTGPFAWDGVFGFWVPAVAFFAWIIVMTMLLLQTIKKQEV